jgi:hypothetical protein
MPLPEGEFRRRLRKVTGEFAGLLGNRDLIDSAPAEVHLYDPNPVIVGLWTAYNARELRVIVFTTTASGERRSSNDVTSQDLPETTPWSAISLYRKNPWEVTIAER